MSLAAHTSPPPRAGALPVLHSGKMPLATRRSLIERDGELNVLDAAVARLSVQQTGGIVVIEAAAGLGKTALVDDTVTAATTAGFRVCRAAPGPLERHFRYGVLRSLLEAPLRQSSPAQREALLDGAAGLAGDLLLQGATTGGDATMRVAHSVMWLCFALAQERPLVLIVDDAQWADRPTLEVLTYLARRVTDLPLLMIVASRRDDPGAPADLLSLLGDVPAATVLPLRPLSVPGAARLIRRHAPDTAVQRCRVCHETAHGNPWLLGELGRQIADHGVVSVCESDPGSVPVSAVARDVVRGRLAALSAQQLAVAAALAVVGPGAAPELAAAVADVPPDELAHARDGLVAAGVLAPQGDRLAHALIGAAVLDDLPRGERERLHRAAASTLTARGAAVEVVASHLLRCAPQGDPTVTAQLQQAGIEAWEQGTPHAAVSYLQRAVEERAPGDPRAELLARLATYSFDAGLPDARRQLHEALGEVRDRASRVDVLTRLATLEVVAPGDDRLHQLLEDERSAHAGDGLELAIEAAVLDMLLMLPERYEERTRRAYDLELPADADPLLRRVVLAHRACLAIERGTPSAHDSAALALEALDGDVLLAEARQRSGFHLAVRALILTDRVDEAARTIAQMREDARARGSMRLEAAAAWYAGLLALRTGHVARAENEARLGLGLLADEPLNMFSGGAIEILVNALAERGAFDEADEILREHALDGRIGERLWEVGILHARARLGFARGDYVTARADAERAGELRERQGRPNPTMTPWRSTAALALARSGLRDHAAELADTELELAERFGAPLPIITALHARLVAEADPQAQLALCERALAIAARAPSSLDTVRVLLEQGTTLVRLGRKIDARAPLGRALAAADAAGATLVAERARRELVASGLRPRRAQREGVEALTPRQRQIAELAASGTSNRAIAQQLFLSIKTVETHLASVFRKLGVEVRAELVDALAARAGP